MTDPGEPAEDTVVDAEIVPDPAPAAVPPPGVAPDYDEHGVPSFDYVRSTIGSRVATSIGMGELAADTPQGRSLEEQEAERAKAAAAKLEEIRRSMGR